MTLKEFEQHVLEHHGAWVNMTGGVAKFHTFEQILRAVPIDFKDDLVGFQRAKTGWVPVFKTMQEKWNNIVVSNSI